MVFRATITATALAAMLSGCGSTEIREAPVTVSAEPMVDLHPLSLGEANKIVGEVSLRNDAQTLFVTVTAHPGATVSDLRVCLGPSAFRYVAPESCGYRALLSGEVSKGTVAIPLADLHEPLFGDVLYVQAAAAIVESGAATGWAYAGTFKGRVGYTVAGGETVQAGACVMSAGEWAGEKAEWPESSLTLGGSDYRKDELLDLLARPVDGDASVALAKQVVAARLNQAAGAQLPVGVAAALDMMDAWMAAEADADGTLPFQVKATAEHVQNSEAFDTGVNTAEMIRQFNAGKLASPACL